MPLHRDQTDLPAGYTRIAGYERYKGHLYPMLRLTDHLTFEPGFAHFVYRPKPDISLQELARIIPWVISDAMSLDIWESLGPMKRHFEFVQPEDKSDAPTA